MHFFDGFRTSHEVAKVEQLTDDDLRGADRQRWTSSRIARGRCRPINPSCAARRRTRTSYFQAREAVNPYYLACPTIVQNAMDRFAELVGRQYHLFDYVGAPDAERVIVMMGSGAEAAQETVEYLRSRAARRSAC